MANKPETPATGAEKGGTLDVKHLQTRKADIVKRMRELKAEEAKVNEDLLRAGVDIQVISYW